jgi:hypothetical protein
MVDAATLTKPEAKSTGMNNPLYRARADLHSLDVLLHGLLTRVTSSDGLSSLGGSSISETRLFESILTRFDRHTIFLGSTP